MAKKNSKPVRVDKDFADYLKEVSIKNGVSISQYTKVWFKKIKFENPKLKMNIKF